jgi:cytoskeletal protein RodZ
MSFFSKLQSKSSATKTRFALAVASGATGILAIIWLSTLPARFAETTPQVSNESDTGLQDFFSETKNQLGNVLDSVKSVDGETSPQETSNLNSLNMNSDTNTAAPATPSEPVSNVGIDNTAAEPAPAPASPPAASTSAPEQKPAENEPKNETPPSPPKVILIGTTTSNSR